MKIALFAAVSLFAVAAVSAYAEDPAPAPVSAQPSTEMAAPAADSTTATPSIAPSAGDAIAPPVSTSTTDQK